MNEMKVVLLVWALGSVPGAFPHEPLFTGAFFHEPSFNELRPSGTGLEASDFGFSIAYQDSAPARLSREMYRERHPGRTVPSYGCFLGMVNRLHSTGSFHSDKIVSNAVVNNPVISTYNQLVVGAPRADFIGKVYSCPLSNLSKAINCPEVDMTSLNIKNKSESTRNEVNPHQNFFFGSSVAATKDYFLTCAPFLTKFIGSKNKRSHRNQNHQKSVLPDDTNVFGACYLYNTTSGNYSEWIDNGVRVQDRHTTRKLKPKTKLNSDAIKAGGVGWNILADNDNGYLLVAKTGVITDILYVDINHPLEVTKSLANDYCTKRYTEFRDYFNMGYGLAVGNFFNKAVYLYAVSTCRPDWKGRILFLEKVDSSGTLNTINDPSMHVLTPYYIEGEAVSSMFGYAMAAADLNKDGLSELLVGAPAQADDGNLREFGALHVYVGGDLVTRNDKNRMRTIFGNKENSRFGSAIAKSDIDGDNIPEIFVSAPYENSGIGAVYVISGYELNRALFKDEGFRQIKLADLIKTQQLRGDSGSKLFGFSLQIAKDIDENGCDELAVGSPASSSVRLLRGLPMVNTSISLKLIGEEIVKEIADSFVVSVCLHVKISPKYKSVIGSISVRCNVTGATSIPTPSFEYEVTNQPEQDPCKNITVNLKRRESAEYTFSAISIFLDVDKNGNRTGKDYKPWVVRSPYSEAEQSIVIKRYCTGKECEPKLSYEILWSGGEITDTSTAQNETVTIVVNNTGHDTKSAFVQLTVQGTRVSSLTNRCFRDNETAAYTCSLMPLKRDSFVTLEVLLNMNELANVPKLYITAQLYDRVFPNIKYEPKHLEIDHRLDSSRVLLNGSRHVLNITDMDLEDNKIVSFTDNHEYYITNNGPVKWVNLTAILKIRNDSFIQNVKTVSTEACQPQNSTGDGKNDYPGQIVFYCYLILKPRSSTKIIASIEISKKIMEIDIGKTKLGTSSELSIRLMPTNETRVAGSSTQINYKKILSFENKKELVIIIVIIAAVTMLLLLIFVLYKYGFFKRTQKNKLNDLRETVRKHSVRKASEISRSHLPSTADDDGCDIEVVDDCAFQDIDIPCPQTTKDDVVLINDTADVHI